MLSVRRAITLSRQNNNGDKDGDIDVAGLYAGLKVLLYWEFILGGSGKDYKRK